jgi:E3 ubiquitin-protein ligase XIAP
MSYLQSRLSTYQKWPIGLSQKPAELAEAGLYYTGGLSLIIFISERHIMDIRMILIGKGDEVICFHCNVMLTSWRQGVKPWEKHAISSSKCGFVKLMKGPRYAVEVCEGKPADAAEKSLDTPEPMEEDGKITGQLKNKMNKSF